MRDDKGNMRMLRALVGKMMRLKGFKSTPYSASLLLGLSSQGCKADSSVVSQFLSAGRLYV